MLMTRDERVLGSLSTTYQVVNPQMEILSDEQRKEFLDELIRDLRERRHLLYEQESRNTYPKIK